jgi:DNA (cytosine-5)-methyltransferase 1
MARGKRNRPVAIDLFCGVGGMSLGFEQAGFDVVAGFDSEQRHVDTFQKNFPNSKAVCLDLSTATGVQIRKLAGIGDREIAVVFGGPPCQGFSLMGKRDRKDPRNRLLSQFARLVGELKPRYFVMENVAGLQTLHGGAFVRRFLRAVRKAGYNVVRPLQVLNAADFGVPQRRKRLFVLGYRCDLLAPQYPRPSDVVSSNGNGFNAAALRPSVRDAIADLPNIEEFDQLLTQDSVRTQLAETSKYVDYLRGRLKDVASGTRQS